MLVACETFGQQATGNPVRIRNGPAAVTAIEKAHCLPLLLVRPRREGEFSSRESEDLPMHLSDRSARDGRFSESLVGYYPEFGLELRSCTAEVKHLTALQRVLVVRLDPRKLETPCFISPL